MAEFTSTSTIILGIDPGLRHTGWGLVTSSGNRLGFIAAGRISPPPDLPLAARLRMLGDGIAAVVAQHAPHEAAIEETFVNANAMSALKLGQARGAAILALAQAGLEVREYAATRVKQALTGHGHADKTQIAAMLLILLPGLTASNHGKMAADAADALAVAIAHAHHRTAPSARIKSG